MRLGINLTDAFGAAYFPIYLKKQTNAEEVKPLRAVLQKMEDFIAANSKEGSPFVMGTENPTQIDVHFFAHLVRIQMMEGSAFNDTIYEHIKFNEYPRIVKLLAAIRARPEFRGTLANPKSYHEFVDRFAAKPPGERVQLFLPCDNDE